MKSAQKILRAEVWRYTIIILIRPLKEEILPDLIYNIRNYVRQILSHILNLITLIFRIYSTKPRIYL